MHQVQVNVVELQALEGVLDGPEDILVTVQVVPDLGAHEDVLPLHGRVLLEEVSDTITDLVLVEVVPGTVEVTVTGTESSGDGVVGLALGTLASEGTEADTGDLDPVAQGKSGCVGHVESIGREDDSIEKEKKEKGGSWVKLYAVG